MVFSNSKRHFLNICFTKYLNNVHVKSNARLLTVIVLVCVNQQDLIQTFSDLFLGTKIDPYTLTDALNTYNSTGIFFDPYWGNLLTYKHPNIINLLFLPAHFQVVASLLLPPILSTAGSRLFLWEHCLDGQDERADPDWERTNITTEQESVSPLNLMLYYSVMIKEIFRIQDVHC